MIDRKECFVAVPDWSADELLNAWRWLIGKDRYAISRITALGDLLLRDEDGRIHWLDIIAGSIKQIADSEKGFDQLLDDREFRKGLLAARIIEDLRNAEKRLAPGQCYSPDHPPCLGGELDIENLQPTDIRIHVSMMGQIHRQIKDLPEGTPITGIKTTQ